LRGDPNKMRLLIAAASLAATATLALVGVGTAAASSSQSCGRAVINDWYVDGTINGQYAPACYRQALSRVGDQMKMYSNLPDQLDRGLRAALQRQQGTLGTEHTITQPAPRQTAGHQPSGPIERVLGELGPSRADSLPVPLLILAGIALLLIAAGAVSAVHRRLSGRRTSR